MGTIRTPEEMTPRFQRRTALAEYLAASPVVGTTPTAWKRHALDHLQGLGYTVGRQTVERDLAAIRAAAREGYVVHAHEHRERLLESLAENRGVLEEIRDDPDATNMDRTLAAREITRTLAEERELLGLSSPDMHVHLHGGQTVRGAAAEIETAADARAILDVTPG